MLMMKKNWILTLIVSSVIAVGACSSQAPGTKPDDMSVEEHQAQAEAHQEMSAEHKESYDPDARAVREKLPVEPNMDIYNSEVYNPTAQHLNNANRHKSHSEQHTKAAQKLLSYEEQQCAKFPQETRSSCPLMGQIKSVADVDGGVRITFNDGVPIQATVDHMKCHFAFARTEGYDGMPSCPLYLEGVSVEAQDDSHSVVFTTDKAGSVAPLRKLTKEHVGQ